MSLPFKIASVFVVCAGITACGSLSKISTADNASHTPGTVAEQTKSPAISVLRPPFQEMEDDRQMWSFLQDFRQPRCLKLPKDDYTYVSDEWIYECHTGIRRTESGDFLVEQLLEKEYQKRTGVYERPVSYPDQQAFRFVG